MSNQKPARVVTCRGCTQEFERSQKNQRYCPACRQSRADALEALRVKVCNHCGVARDDCKNAICADCREIARVRSNANYEAAKARKLARVNAKGGCPCGKPATCPYSGLCDECDIRKRNQSRRAFREQQRQEAAPQQDTPTDEARAARLESYAEAIADLPYKTMIQVIALLLDPLLGNKEGSAVPENVANPEQVDADDQDGIDSAFNDLMDGVL